MKEKINMQMVFKQQDDYSNFNLKLEDHFSDYNKNIKKKLLICSVELIQNNLIHNEDQRLMYTVLDCEDYLKLSTTIYVSVEIYKILVSWIETINSLDVETLKLRYLKNITSEINDQKENVGNGLILCKLKSYNDIGFKIVESYANQNILQVEISLKFNKHGNNR